MIRAPKNGNGFLLRLPHSLKQDAATKAAGDGVSLNHFIVIAVAEKIARENYRQTATADKRPGSDVPKKL